MLLHRHRSLPRSLEEVKLILVSSLVYHRHLGREPVVQTLGIIVRHLLRNANAQVRARGITFLSLASLGKLVEVNRGRFRPDNGANHIVAVLLVANISHAIALVAIELPIQAFFGLLLLTHFNTAAHEEAIVAVRCW